MSSIEWDLREALGSLHHGPQCGASCVSASPPPAWGQGGQKLYHFPAVLKPLPRGDFQGSPLESHNADIKT